MNDQITPGDLCIVVRDCCGHWLGAIRTVRSIRRIDGILWCDKCHRSWDGITIAELGEFGELHRTPVSWLKRIKPLSESEGAETLEVIEA